MLLPEPLPTGGSLCDRDARRAGHGFRSPVRAPQGWEQVDKLVCGVRVSNKLPSTLVIARCCRGCGSTGSMPSLWNNEEHTLFRPLEAVSAIR
jgi:hypothetical protein